MDEARPRQMLQFKGISFQFCSFHIQFWRMSFGFGLVGILNVQHRQNIQFIRSVFIHKLRRWGWFVGWVHFIDSNSRLQLYKNGSSRQVWYESVIIFSQVIIYVCIDIFNTNKPKTVFLLCDELLWGVSEKRLSKTSSYHPSKRRCFSFHLTIYRWRNNTSLAK